MKTKTKRVKNLVSEIRKLRESVRLIERQKEMLAFRAKEEIKQLNQRIEAILEPAIKYFNFYPQRDSNARDTVPEWKIDGTVAVAVKMTVDHVRMRPRGNNQAWLDEFCRYFANQAYEAARRKLSLQY